MLTSRALFTYVSDDTLNGTKMLQTASAEVRVYVCANWPVYAMATEVMNTKLLSGVAHMWAKLTRVALTKFTLNFAATPYLGTTEYIIITSLDQLLLHAMRIIKPTIENLIKRTRG